VPATGQVVFEVLDAGSGVANPDNLFVPFFTTKPGGSGIGLVLARQVAEGHGGTVSLANRTDRTGCRARLVIPG
jgi:signal transduction histidine kinase